MSDERRDVDDGWDAGWQEHKVRQLLRLARLPFPEKLEWLERAQVLANRLAESKRQQERHSGPD